MSHLPCSHHQQNTSLSQSPPQHPLVGVLTGLPEPLLPVPLVVLLLGDLLYLVQELPHPKLQLGQFLLLCNICIVYSVLSNLDVQMDSKLGAGEPFGRVGVQAEDMLTRSVGGEGELALAAVHLGQDDLVIRIPDLHMHANLRTGGCKPVSPGVVQLHLVVARHHGVVWDFLNETLSFSLTDVEIKS